MAGKIINIKAQDYQGVSAKRNSLKYQDRAKSTNNPIVKEMGRLAKTDVRHSAPKQGIESPVEIGPKTPHNNTNSEQVSPRVLKLVKKPFGRLATDPKVINLSLLSRKIRDFNIKKRVPQPIITIKNKPQLATVVVSQDDHLTYLYDKDGRFQQSFKNAVGKSESPTHSGIRQITGIEKYPYSSANGTKRKEHPIAYGPEIITNVAIDPKTGKKTDLGEFLHGTNRQNSIGKNSSGGCVRHRNDDIIRLANRVQSGQYILILPNGLNQ